MNEQLAVEILTRIKNNIQGHHDIYRELRETDTYFNLKPEVFADVINELKGLECIKNISSGHPKTYEIWPGKDCLSKYEQLIIEGLKTGEKEQEMRELTIRNLNLQNEVLILEKREIKRKVMYGIAGFTAGGILTNIKDIIEWLSSISK